jgi:hypothetical protein
MNTERLRFEMDKDEFTEFLENREARLNERELQ